MKDILSDETLLARWLSNQLSPDEVAALEAHEAYEDLVAIVQGMEQLEPVIGQDNDAGYSSLQQILKGRKKIKVRRLNSGRRYLIIGSIAASICLLVGFWLWSLFAGITSISTPLASKEMVNLPDASTVLLQADSKLSYKNAQYDESRELELLGEAYFKVESGNSFIVNTPNGQIEVTGTEFNVYARNDVLEVICTEGSVIVSTANKDQASQNLKKGEAIRFVANQKELSWEIPSSININFAAQSYCQQCPLARVFEDLERQFKVEVEYDPSQLKIDRFEGYYDRNNLDIALRNIMLPMGIEYEQTTNIIKLK